MGSPMGAPGDANPFASKQTKLQWQMQSLVMVPLHAHRMQGLTGGLTAWSGVLLAASLFPCGMAGKHFHR